MTKSASSSNARAAPDSVLVDIAEYVLNYRIESERAYDTARLCLADCIACALGALDIPECASLLGPVVPGHDRAARRTRARHAIRARPCDRLHSISAR
jgi:2-methylcitrate dehydratase PrpD